MKLKVLGTGSSGNCYALRAKNGETLLIECGLTFKEIKKGLDFDLSNVSGCLLSHEHGDHSKCPQEIIDSGINLYTSFGTASKLELNRATCVIEKDVIKINNFTVKAFKVIHDCAEPFGFLVSHPEMGVLCFATDTKRIPHDFDGVNHWLIEANYWEEMILNQLAGNKLNAFLAHRITQNHQSLEDCMEFYSRQAQRHTKSVTLIHLSESNASAKLFKDRWASEFGFYPNIAKNNAEIDL